MTHLSDLEILTDVVAKHKSGELCCPATALIDRYYCINSAQTKEIMVHYILQPHHIFIRVKAFIFVFVSGGLQFFIISTCFVRA